jgi:transcription elongation GreA/GreB family factor
LTKAELYQRLRECDTAISQLRAHCARYENALTDAGIENESLSNELAEASGLAQRAVLVADALQAHQAMQAAQIAQLESNLQRRIPRVVGSAVVEVVIFGHG